MTEEFSSRRAKTSSTNRDEQREFAMRGREARVAIVKAARLLSDNLVVRINGKASVFSDIKSPRRTRRLLGPIADRAIVSVRVEQLPPVIVKSTNAEIVLNVGFLPRTESTSRLNSMAELSKFLKVMQSEVHTGSGWAVLHKGPYPVKKPSRPRPKPSDASE